MIGKIIDDIIQKYYNENEEYYEEYRKDEENKNHCMKKEVEEALTEKGVEYVIGTEESCSFPGYDNDFLAVAYIEEDGSLGLRTVFTRMYMIFKI